LNYENKELKEKIELLEKKVLKAKFYIKERQEETRNMNEKMERVEMDKEKVKNEFENYKKATQEVGKLMSLNEENVQLKSDYEFTLKMVENLQAKLKTMQHKHDENMKEMKEKVKIEMDGAEALRIELENKERRIESIQKSVKQVRTRFL
jgi:chromosome segregation ATPase